MKTKLFILNPIFVGVLSAMTSYSLADNVWIGGVGDYKDDSNWSTGSVPADGDGNIIINQGDANLLIDNSFNGLIPAGGYGMEFTIGGNASEKGQLNVTLGAGAMVGWQDHPTLNVGVAGGHGTFVYDVRDNQTQYTSTSFAFGSTNVGKGQHSEGFINILGSGKNYYEQDMGYVSMSVSDLTVGSNGGSGIVTVDGASFDVAGYNAVWAPSGNPTDVFLAGDGAGSTGVVNVLGGGKLTVAMGFTETNAAILGANGGTGVLNISGYTVGENLDGNHPYTSSRAIFYNGLIVGDGADSQGFINISDKGSLLTYGEASVGKNGGAAHVVVSGEGSQWQVAGSSATSGTSTGMISEEGVLTLGSVGGTGVLTIDDAASVSIGTSTAYNEYYHDPDTGTYYNYQIDDFVGGTGTLQLTDSADSTGTVVFKGDAGRVGVLDAKEISFGTGQGTIAFNHNDYTGNYEFDMALVGSNSNSKIENYSGHTVFNTDYSDFAGHTYVKGGVFEVNNILGGKMTIDNGGILAGVGTVGDTTLNAGGFIYVGKYNDPNPVASVLTIDGNYQGNNGTIVFDTVLYDDYSATDKLIVTGDVSGTTYIRVDNMGGLGAETIQGIELIEVQGNNNGTFAQSGRIVSGAYDYYLVQGDPSTGADPNSWYLSSRYSTGGGIGNYLRPEAGTYVGLLENNLTAFNHSFHDRQQTLNDQYKATWMRVDYGYDKYRIGQDNQLSNRVIRKSVHLGTDLYQKDKLHLGVMAGYSNSDISNNSRKTNNHASGQSNGYSIGVYATWYDQEAQKGGLYVDSYAQYNWFRNQVNGYALTQEKFNTEGHTISLESGYGIVLSQNKQTAWTLEPQVQLIYSNSSSINYTESNGTRVQSTQQKDHLKIRTGLRLQAETDHVKLFLTGNYWNQNKYAAITMDNTKVNSNRAKHLFELKTGVQYQVTDKLDIYGQVNALTGSDSTRSYGGNIGIKYRW